MARDSTLGHQKRVVVMPSSGGGGGVAGGGVDVGLSLDSVPLSAESQEILEVRDGRDRVTFIP